MTEIRVFGHYLNVPMILFALMDVAVVGISLYATGREGIIGHSPLPILFFALCGSAMVLLGKAAVGLYQSKIRVTMAAVLLRTLVAFFLGMPVLILAGVILPLAPGILAQALLVGLIAYGALGFVKACFFLLADSGALRRRVLVLGAGKTALAIQSMRRRADRRGFKIIGYVPSDDTKTVVGPLASPTTPLCRYAVTNRINEIVVAMSERRNKLPIEELVKCRFEGIEVTDLGTFMEREAGKVPLALLRSGWNVFDGTVESHSARITKRILDVAGAVLLLLLALPVIIAATLAIKRTEGWKAPVFYRQARVGKDGKPFKLVKFRSMRIDAEADGRAVWASRNDDRVTNVGRILRKTRIDEIPQLFNVLQGSMSLVGPRPERPEFVADLADSVPFYTERHRIRPGISGWAQLMYPYGASREDAREKLQYDLYYLKHRSTFFDLMILLQTVEVVLFGKGAR